MSDDYLNNSRLRKFSIFEDLSDETLESIKSRIMVVRFGRGETIIAHEALDTDVFLLLDG